MNHSGAFPGWSAEGGAVPLRCAARRGRAKAAQDALQADPWLARKAGAEPSSAELTELARLLMSGLDEPFREDVESRLAHGVPPVSVMIKVFAPIAREIGRLWDCDECDLIDVQLATGALKRAMGQLSARAVGPVSSAGRSILMQAAPGESHTLGVDVAEAVFRGMGWRVARAEGREGLRAGLAGESRDFVGFSLSCDRHVEALAEAIAEARAVSRNPRLLVVVGGAIFVQHPELARKIGSDFCVCASELAVQHPEALVNGSPMSHLLLTRV